MTHFAAYVVADSQCFSVGRTTPPPKKNWSCLLGGGSRSTSNIWFHGPTRVYPPNGISIGSSVIAGFKNMTNRHTYRQTHRQTKLLRRYQYAESIAIAEMRPYTDNNYWYRSVGGDGLRLGR